MFLARLKKHRLVLIIRAYAFIKPIDWYKIDMNRFNCKLGFQIEFFKSKSICKSYDYVPYNNINFSVFIILIILVYKAGRLLNEVN